MIFLLLGCAHPSDSATDPCADTPVVTWANFGQGFLLQECQGCHASTAINRFGAPEAVYFDTVDDAWRLHDDILDQAGAEPPTMPPSAATKADDRQLLRWWLNCAAEGT